MPAPRTPVVNQFQQDGTAQLNPPIILTVCQDIGSEWRERCLDPVTPFPLFFVQVAPGKTACTHRRHLPTLDVTASAYCQARTRLPLEVFTRLLWAVGDAVVSGGGGLRRRPQHLEYGSSEDPGHAGYLTRKPFSFKSPTK